MDFLRKFRAATLLLCLSATAAASDSFDQWQMPDEQKQLSIYQIMVASYMHGEGGAPGHTDLWGPPGHRVDGNLKGIIESLDYIKSMGMNAIWLTPIFDTTNGWNDEKMQATGYFATDYFKIDPRFGTNEEFKELCDKAHERGMYVFLDAVYGHHGGCKTPSPKGNIVTNIPGTVPPEVKYPESLDYFKEVTEYWIENYAVDGFRLDQSYQLVQNGHNYWKEIRETVEDVCARRKARGEKWGTLGYLVAEDWNVAANITTTKNEGIHSVFDFDGCNALRSNPFGYLQWVYTSPQARGYDKGVVPNLFIGNHDMHRISGVFENRFDMVIAMVSITSWSGPVTFFYNDEFGDANGIEDKGDNSRTSGRTEPANEEEAQLQQIIRGAFTARAENPAMWRGDVNLFEIPDKFLYVIEKTDTESDNQVVTLLPKVNTTYDIGGTGYDYVSKQTVGPEVTLQRAVPMVIRRDSRQGDENAVKVYLNYESSAADDTFYTFVYDSEGIQSPNSSWPGQKMKRDETLTVNGIAGGWYVYTVPTRLAAGGLAMVSDNSTRRYPADMEPGIALNGSSLAFVFREDKWTVTSSLEVSKPDDILTEQTDFTPSCKWGTTKRFLAHCSQLDTDYTVDVLLPEGYDPSDAARYPVVYMHDGQNLFDPSISFGGVSWGIDKVLSRLSQWNTFRTPIIVGVHNREELRASDYLCQKVITDYIPADQLDAANIMYLVNNHPNSDAYTSFLANDLKKAIDARFNTLADRDNTFIMGSSMGGLASLYAMCEYPDVYGGAACLSTHWIGNFDYNSTIFPTAVLAYMADRLPSPDTHKLYLDHGTEGLDSAYPQWNRKALETAAAKDYSQESGSLLSYIAKDADHNERSWSERVNIPMQFMLDEGEHPYQPFTPEVQKFHVVFCDPDMNWNPVNTFTWGGGATQTGTWPGTAMTPTTYEGKPAWEITFEHATEPTNIIFNDMKASGVTQTADLEFVNNSVYDFSGVIATLSSASIRPDEGLSIRIEDGFLNISSDRQRTVALTALDGTSRLIRLEKGENIIADFPEGVFIVNGRKMIAK